MKLNQIKSVALLLGVSIVTASAQTYSLQLPPIAGGPFKADWNSLTNYSTPEWFRDAKFGLWAHWGPECVPAKECWYAQVMYYQNSGIYKYHQSHFGHPSVFGFKDILPLWKAEHFDPEKLLTFYKENGAKYFVALANFHSNFDNWDSKYQPWNSVNIGPHKDIIGMWEKAARNNSLRFGVSLHASRPWYWYEPSQGSDKTGPLAGVPYDGKLTKADGKGKWWEGYDPQELYCQNHKPGNNHYGWGDKNDMPDAAHLEKYFNRTKQLFDDYHPDLVYFDDWVLPFHGCTDEVGLNLAAHFYNSSVRQHGTNEVVMNCKQLDKQQRKAMVYDIERGKTSEILPQPWQTDTCIGGWHYRSDIHDTHGYKTAPMIVQMLADIVSKNGNLLLSIPVRADGTIDDDETAIVQGIGAWLKINGEAIYATRPWIIYGEGPSTVSPKSVNQHDPKSMVDVPNNGYTSADIRFTQSKDHKTLFAIVLEIPKDRQVTIKSLASNSANWPGKIGTVRLVGGSWWNSRLKFTRDENGLHVTLPEKLPSQIACALKIQP